MPGPPARRGAGTGASLERTTFRTSRLLDFMSEKELVAQIGHPREEWPLVALKELVDNALDACEEQGVAPELTITVDESGITVADNGPGIPAETVEGVLDFAVRVSSREAYVSPTRGAQGNALKTLVAMPFVLDGEQGQVAISGRGVRHEITVSVDRIRQQPVVAHEQATEPDVREGTEVRICWPESASSLAELEAQFLQVADDYSWLNPHLTLALDWFGATRVDVRATDPTWTKCLASDPTSAHWYEPEHLERLIAAYIAHDADHGRERTVRQLVAEFRGLSGTAKQKQVLAATGLARAKLSELVSNGGIDPVKLRCLLAAMQEHSKPVKPAALGFVGRQHLERRLEKLGHLPESFQYHRQLGTTAEGIPAVVETAFAYLPESGSRRIVTGVNWSPGIRNPFRSLGPWGQSLDDALRKQFVSHEEPILFLAHLIQPRVAYTDRGKSAVAL